MDILVWSDSHGHREFVMRILEKEAGCKTVFFLGDGISEAEYAKELFPDRKFILVRGNNDFHCDAERFAYKHVDGVTFMACHGDTLSVRFSLRELFDKADAVRAHIALYGHTHVPKIQADPYSGVCAVNPGALCNGSYCVISVNKGKYDIFHKQI